MNVTEKISGKIDQMPSGTTFKYQQLGIARSEYPAGTKAIERLIRKGVINRVSSGVFYKPTQSAFGALKPSDEELLKPYLFEDGKRIAYITGGSLYNRMGLTRQIPKVIKVACKDKRIITRIGNTQVKPAKSYIEVTDENYCLLEILDALKDFKNIPDLDKKSAITLLTGMIRKLNKKDLSKMIRYALKYPPRTKALLGAILDCYFEKINTKILTTNLNPLTSYNIGIKEDILTTAQKWNID